MTKYSESVKIKSMKNNTVSALLFFSIFSFSVQILFSQEALKSTEEGYYDFLSLTGITERPTLGYRTLSDSQWNFIETEAPLHDADGKVLTDENGNPVMEKTIPSHVWQKNNLGKKRTLWQSENRGSNWFTRGFDHSVRFKAYGPEWYNSFNTAAPYGQNDGALWQGKGYNSSLTGGARLEAYGFEVTIKPQLCFSQNLGFDIMPNHAYDSEYSYFQPGIDLPQRFGDKPFWTFDWGDTEIRWTWHNFTIGFGSQSPWLGPAWLNPMLGSNNAASYPKFDFGLRKTAIYLPKFGWHIGDIEGRIWVGRLEESDYFDNNPDNKYRMLNALSLSFSPGFIPGLTVGVNRIFITNWKLENLKYLGRLFTTSHANDISGDGEDQKASLFANWRFPTAGFEIYGEIGIDDFTSDSISNPFHTAVYTVGLKQNIPLFQFIQKHTGTLKSELILEWNNFEMSQDFQLQWKYSGYYSHGKIWQGYTNQGQLLGAGSGYHGNSQFLGYKVYYTRGSIMGFYHRSCPDNNYIYNMAVSTDASYPSKTSKDYYAQYRTYNAWGLQWAHFVTKNLKIEAEYVYMFLASWLYGSELKNGSNSQIGYRFSLAGKYNF